MLFYHGGNTSERGQKISSLKEKVGKYICMSPPHIKVYSIKHNKPKERN